MLRRALRGMFVVALFAGLAASAGAAAPSETAAGAAPAPTGRIVVGRTADVNTLDPHKATTFHAIQTLELIYGMLVQLNPKLELVPGLARSWRFTDNLRTLTFTLRTGVRFHDGSAFDSQDVAASLRRILDPATGAVTRANLGTVTAVETPNARTVVLRLSSPNTPILAALADTNAAILSSADIASGSFTRTPNGTGPFRFASWTPNQVLRLAANRRYWARTINIANLEFRVIPDELSVLSALRSRNVQLGVVSDPLVARQARGGGLTVHRTPSLSYHVLQLNARRGPLTKYFVRLAISCALDRKQVLDSAALGEGSVVGPITSPAYKSDPNDRPCPKPNLTKARQLLTQAGHPNGVTLKTIVGTGSYATAVNEAQSAKAQLQRVGITLDLEIMDFPAYVRRWLAGDFDAAIALNGGRVDPDTMYGRYFTSTGNLNQVAGYAKPKLDELFAAGRATVVVWKRRQIYKQISQILEDNAVWVWMFSSYDYRITTQNVRGFVAMPNGSLQYLRQARLVS